VKEEAMVSRNILCIAAAGLSLAALGKSAQRTAPVPSDPLEMVTGQSQVVNTATSRAAALDLLAQASKSYALRSSGQAYDLKVKFTVTSSGETQYDGAWEMEDVFDPTQGLRWTAKAEAGFTTTQIAANGMFYGEGTSSTMPLRLQEARAALFDPIPSARNVERQVVRTSAATFHGVQLTCVLFSGSKDAAIPGRRWEETEECIDPQSGLLMLHSQIPGRYYAYEYGEAPQPGAYLLPKTVTVTEAGKTVSVISVVSLEELSSVDPSLFQPTEAMLAKGPSVAMAGAQKIASVVGKSGSDVAQPVCIFGLVTATGELVEAHSLQPADPNSAAALEAAKRTNFSHPAAAGSRPQQHFVFLIEKFVASQ
jgi:hypothetical protein